MKRLIFFSLILIHNLSVFSQSSSIKGIISDPDGEGLVGVNIIIQGTARGTVSGLHGDYLLDNIPPGDKEITFSYLGYETKNVSLNFKAGEQKSFNVTLKEGVIDLSALTIEARQPFSAASSKAIRDFDLKVKPVRSAQDILLLVPGLYIAQHAGGGKAEQIFMRGFDADHGTDVGIYVDGLPVNMVSHGHGQGYADLHFIIPEIVDGLTVNKGPYSSRYGNFGTAGSVEFTTTDHPDHNLVKLEGGMFNTVRATTVLKIPTTGKHQSAYLAGQYSHSDGPFSSPQDFNRMNLYGKFHTHITPRSELGFAVSAFTSAWDASGQIPQRAINSGTIDRWGAIDDTEGGTTGRYNVSVDYRFTEGYDHDFVVQAYLSKYDFKLFSNFTLFLNDSINGDMIEQNDHRTIQGITTRYTFNKYFGNLRTATRFGTTYRGDNIKLGLWKSPDRERLEAQTEHEVKEVNTAFWLEEDLVFNPKVKLQLGIRGDYFTFDVIDLLDNPLLPGNNLPHASGYSQSAILSPKVNLVWTPLKNLDIYLNGGTGFHSNDARDVILAARIREIIHRGHQQGLDDNSINQELMDKHLDPEQANINTLPRAIGSEIGSRLILGKHFLISVAAWYLHMEEELVFIGDEGNTEISGETQRLGIDFEMRTQLTTWIWADLDMNFADGRYINEPSDANYIPLAPRFTSQGGINLLHPKGFEGAFRCRYIGNRPANEDNSVVATGHFLANIIVGYRLNKIRLFAQLENLLGTEWNEAQFDTESRLLNEAEPVSELHFTPGNPINLQVGISYEF